MKKRVLIIYNEPALPKAHAEVASEWEIVDTVDAVQRELEGAGFEVNCLAVGRDPSVIRFGLETYRPNAVFNLFEGTADAPATEASVAELLERRNVPFTGCPSWSLALGLSKHRAKELLRRSGLPTPKFFLVKSLPIADRVLPWPVIAKPAMQDGSVGIDQGSVLTDRERLEQRVAYLLRRYGGPVLVEQFIPGREFSVALIESASLLTLPILEIEFQEKAGVWPILTYDAKWSPESRDYEASVPNYRAAIAPRLARELEDMACRTFRLLRCRDYARIDFRVSPSGVPYVLEVNPNPDLSPQACFAGMLKAAGHSYSEFIVSLFQRAVARGDQAVIVNLAEARFECTFGRGCDGVCCKQGRPLVYPEEVETIGANLKRFLPLLRPRARQAIEEGGYLSGRRRLGQPVMRVRDGWCVFFHQGCILHKVGAAEGDKFRYKPAVCALFPIQQDQHDRWYVRQKGFNKEKWDLFCLDPKNSPTAAAQSLGDEIALATRYSQEATTPAPPQSSEPN